MSDKDLIQALRGIAVETGSHVCQGCGYEHDCREHGCALIFKAAARLQALTEPANDPLTLDELREMDGEPVWMKCLDPEIEGLSCWGIRESYYTDGYLVRHFDKDYGITWLAYRRKPENT